MTLETIHMPLLCVLTRFIVEHVVRRMAVETVRDFSRRLPLRGRPIAREILIEPQRGHVNNFARHLGTTFQLFQRGRCSSRTRRHHPSRHGYVAKR